MSAAGSLELGIGRPRATAGARATGLPMIAALAFAAAALLSLLYLAQTSGVAITGYDIQALEAQRNQWRYRNDQLRLQIAETQSLDRVERESSQRLGMGPPRQVMFVRRPVAPGPTSPAAAMSDESGVVGSARKAIQAFPGWPWGDD